LPNRDVVRAVGRLGAGGSGVQDGGGDPFGYPTWVSEGGFIRLAAGLWPGAAYLKASPLPPAPLSTGNWLTGDW